MTTFLLQLNQLLYAAVLIVAFSLLAYIALQNWRNPIARALVLLLGAVVFVYASDVLINRAVRSSTIQFLLRAQWLGIAVVPAAYLHLARALLLGNVSSSNTWVNIALVGVGYLMSVLFFGLALFTDLVVWGGIPSGPLAQFGAGPLFWLFVVFFLVGATVAFYAILSAYRGALVPTLKRRLTYLGATFAAPGLAVFPYLIIAGTYTLLPPEAILILSCIGSVVVATMLTVMTYSVAFQGMLLPDRLIKQDFLRWWLYGPFVGIIIILCIQVVPSLERLLGLPSDTLITFGVMIMTVLLPIFVSRVKPYLDTLVYMQDREEIAYLRELPRSMFTRTDLRQLLENSLIAICGALRVEIGFVVGPGPEGYTVKAICGSRHQVKRFVAEHPLVLLIPQLQRLPSAGNGMLPAVESFIAVDGFCLLPLRSPDGEFLGALGVAYPAEALRDNGSPTLNARPLINALAHQMELALTTVQMQQRIFDTLRDLGPEMQSLQQLSTRLEQATPASLEALETDLVRQPEFPQLVKDALTQFWGGPKLSDSPLLGLRTVKRAIDAQQGLSPTRALQSVLRQAIANLRPDEQLDPSAQEWLLYNLLEGRFLQRKTVRDIAHRLAMSESDFYRKQRIAVEEVARQIVLMEDGEKSN
jgi:hypothetical protein